MAEPLWGAARRGYRTSRRAVPLAPHLLENLSPPPARCALASTAYLAGGGPLLRYGLLREGRGGGPSDRLYRADDRGQAFQAHPFGSYQTWFVCDPAMRDP